MTRIRVEGRILHMLAQFDLMYTGAKISDLPNDIALKQDSAHGLLEDIVDLADLSELKRTGCASEQEANDNKNRIVENANVDIFRNKSKHGGHDSGWKNHTAKQRGNQ